jgi:ribokinase
LHPNSYSFRIYSVLHKGANFALPDPPTQNNIERHLTGSSHLLLQNEIPWASTLAYLEYAHARGIVTIFNPSPVPADAEMHAFPWMALSWLIVNEGEAESLLHVIGGNPGNNEVEEEYPVDWPDNNILRPAFLTLNKLRRNERLVSTGVVCTLGAAGVLASICDLKEILYFPAAALESNVRDTTGAGDCFTGYFVAGLMESKNKQLSMDEAVELLRLCVQVCLPTSKRTISTQILGGRNVRRKERRDGEHSRTAGRRDSVISRINV